MKKVTTKDIADKLNLSRNTVSRALNNQAGVGKETRKKILRIANEMGYTTEKTSNISNNKKIAIISTNFTLNLQSFFGTILENIKNRLESKNYKVDVFPISKDFERKIILPFSLNKKNYNGLIILSFLNQDYLRALTKLNIPTVMVDHHLPYLNIDSVLTENTDGTIIALKYLQNIGYKSIGFIGNIDFSPSYFERYIGFNQFFKNNNLLTTNKEWTLTNIDEKKPNELFNKLRKLNSMPEIWFTVNNGFASMLSTFLQGNGYSIPDDIGIISFDDTDIAKMVNPNLTVIATDLKEMADQTCIMLKKRMTNQKKNNIFYLRLLPHMIIRQSTRPKK